MTVITDPDIIAGYLADASGLVGTAHQLYRPSTTADVSKIVALCHKTRQPVTISAARTSTTGGPVPWGSAILNMERMSTIQSIDDPFAVVQVGVKLGNLHRVLAQHGRLFPPDPTSRDDASLGGAIAANASGARSYKYGATRPWIEALEVVWADGTTQWVDRQTPWPRHWPTLSWKAPTGKNAAGYASNGTLLDTLVGSEGTLAVITTAKIRTVPTPPHTLVLILPFDTIDDALPLLPILRGIDQYGPSAIEYLDIASTNIAREAGLVAPKDKHLLILEIPNTDSDACLAWWGEFLENTVPNTIVASTDEEQEAVRRARHAVPATINETARRHGHQKMATDFAVPDAAFATIIDAYNQAPVPHFLFGHFGQNHLHLNLLPTTEAQVAIASDWLVELAQLAVSLGGTITAEHGVGKTKRTAFAAMVGPEAISRHRALKNAADPLNILGPNTLFFTPTV